MKTVNIEVEGIHCHNCVQKIITHFQAIEDILEVKVNLEEQRVVVTGEDDFSNMKVRNHLLELGFRVISIKKETL